MASRYFIKGCVSKSFGDEFARNVIFGANNCSSRHSKNCRNNFLLFGEDPTDDNNDVVGDQEKSLVYTLLNHEQNFA